MLMRKKRIMIILRFKSNPIHRNCTNYLLETKVKEKGINLFHSQLNPIKINNLFHTIGDNLQKVVSTTCKNKIFNMITNLCLQELITHKLKHHKLPLVVNLAIKAWGLVEQSFMGFSL